MTSLSTQVTPSACAVFVHGVFSGPHIWDQMVRLLEADPQIRLSVTLNRFTYESPKVQLDPLKRIPTIEDAAAKLETWIKNAETVRRFDRIALVGHSQGGLVIQQFLSRLLEANDRDQLRTIRSVVLLATPNTGSELFLSLRKSFSFFWKHPQEEQLRPYDRAIERMREAVFRKIVLAATPSNGDFPIRFFVYAGESDGVVPPRSAKWMFPNAGMLPGDHSTILQPPDRNDVRFLAVRSALRWARHSVPPDGLLFETLPIDLGRKEEIAAVVQIQAERISPGQAVSPNDLEHWLSDYQEAWNLRLRVLVAKLNGAIKGFIMFHESSDLILVDYIAVQKTVQHSALLVEQLVARVRERSASLGNVPMVFEVEDPNARNVDRSRALARVRYFQRMGARTIKGVSYVAPNMKTVEAGDEIPHLLMYACAGEPPASLTPKAVHNILTNIYQVWYRNWFSHYPKAAIHESYLRSLCARVVASTAKECLLVKR